MYRRKDQEPFHATLAQVKMDYPVDTVIPALKSMYPSLNEQPSTIKFAMLPNPPIPYIFGNSSNSAEYKQMFKLMTIPN